MTALAGAIAAKYQNLKLIHLEAGIRSFNLSNPYPEEMIRYIIDHFSDVLFTTTDFTENNLAREHIIANVFRVGNTIVDMFKKQRIKKAKSTGRKRILVTVHRRDNFGLPLMRVCSAIRILAMKYSDEIEFIIPVHLNPNISETIHQKLNGFSNIVLRPPLDYWEFLSILKSSYLVITDSGGLCEEAPSFSIPVLILRELTDRQESVKLGFARVVGTSVSSIIDNVMELLTDKDKYLKMKATWNPYGDGTASKRIIEILKANLSGIILGQFRAIPICD